MRKCILIMLICLFMGMMGGLSAQIIAPDCNGGLTDLVIAPETVVSDMQDEVPQVVPQMAIATPNVQNACQNIIVENNVGVKPSGYIPPMTKDPQIVLKFLPLGNIRVKPSGYIPPMTKDPQPIFYLP